MARPKIKITATMRRRITDLIKKGLGRREAFPIAGVTRITMYRWQAKAEKDNQAGIESDETKLFAAVEKAEGELIEAAIAAVNVGKDVSAFEMLSYLQKRLDRKEAAEDATRAAQSGGMDGYKPPPVE